jgi:RHS repeat-associated protein
MDITRWIYHEATGLLTTKQDASIKEVLYTYDTLSRTATRRWARVDGGGNPVITTYSYDPNSAQMSVSSGSQTATYAYYPTTGLLNTTTFTGGTQLVRSYDPLGRLQTIATTTPASGTVASYTYTHNNLDQRTRVTREDNSYWSYGYNDRGELTSGKKYWSDSSSVAGQQSEYVFDSIGNRTSTKAGGDPQGLNLRQASYSANSLNQYQQRTVPGALDVLGTANAAATVTVNDQATYRRGEYFHKELAVDNSLAPAYPQVKAVGVRSGIGGAGEDAVTQMDGHIYVPKNVELYGYDADGNLTTDGRWTYTWDGENRLNTMQAIAAAPVAAKLRLEFAYDYVGRRIQKKVYVWNVGTSTYLLQSTTKFVYDGWNVTAELDGSNSLIRTYVWGQDISRTLIGAGGMGGLLLINEAGVGRIAGYDGSENVTMLVKYSDGIISAAYEYDPFGNLLKSVGEYATRNPIRFGTKYTDQESGLVNFGHRYYNSQSGRWLSKDPIAPENGINLYSYVVNAPTNFTDPDGLQIRERGFYRDKGRRYDESSPNWNFASGGLDRIYHRMTLCVPKLSMEKAMSNMFEELLAFKYFEPNIAKLKQTGNRGHFAITDPQMAGTAELAGNSIDVIFYTRFPQKQHLAVTTGNHPLVAVRMWRVEQAGTTSSGTSVINVITEAFDQANGYFNDWGRYAVGRDQQMEMWNKYLANIENGWKRTYQATRVGKVDKFIAEGQSLPNPFKAFLPADLQVSKYIPYDNILP